MNRDVEILAPAGSMECLRAAVAAGADAIYLGGTKFGARAYAQNLSEEDLVQAIEYVHIHGRKIYMTVNTLLKDRELNELYAYLLPYYKAGLDGVIVQDIGAVKFIGEYFPEMPVHASTQMTITNTLGADFLKRYGITRVVPARELSLKEIRDMKKQTGLEMECFVHGALCYCYSGQCLLSSMIGGRSGNRGQCAQPCRLPYQTEGKKPADLMSLKDLCTIDILPELIDAGIDSFKIEGRMKQPEYVYTVVKMYRKYADQYLKLQKEGKGKSSYHVSEADKRELLATYQRRGYCEGYYYQHNGKDMVSLKRPKNGRDGSAEEKPWQDIKVQEKINGILTLSVGNRAKLTVSCGDVTVECIGQEVQAAQKQPLDPARIEKQMRKTGNTEFTFDNLEILVEGNVFLPMQALNELRRTSLEKLERELLGKYRRESGKRETDDRSEKKTPKEMELHVLLDTPDGFDTVLELESVRELQLEADGFEPDQWSAYAFSCHEAGKRCVLALPVIFRTEAIRFFEKNWQYLTEAGFDGLLVRSMEEIVYVKEKGFSIPLFGDHNLYVFNQTAKETYDQMGLTRQTLPLELNSQELEQLGCQGMELVVYGYLPVMTSAQCIQKTTDRCTHRPGLLRMRDRTGKDLPVKNRCTFCYNTIYNPSPLSLLGQEHLIHRLAPDAIRLQFTWETKEQIRQIVQAYRAVFLEGKTGQIPFTDITRGHFKRGVE